MTTTTIEFAADGMAETFRKAGKRLRAASEAPDNTDGPPEPGHNSVVGGVSADRLRSIVERVERLAEEKKTLSEDVADVFTEAKSAGFDVKVLRQVIRLRKMSAEDLQEQEALLALYQRALA